MIAVIVSSLFVATITVIADLVLPIKDWLKNTYGHHWVGKGIWVLILFVFFTVTSYPFLRKNSCDLSPKMVYAAGHFALVSTLIITAFFLYEYLAH